MRRGLAPLQARQIQRAEVAEEYRDQLMTGIEGYIEGLRKTNPTAAVEAQQQAKLLKLQTKASWWIERRAWAPATLLRRPT